MILNGMCVIAKDFRRTEVVGALQSSHSDTAINAGVGGVDTLHAFFSSSGSHTEKMDEFTMSLQGGASG